MSSSEKDASSYYIFIATDCDVSRLAKPSAYDVARYRLERREWGLGEHTRNRNAIQRNDHVLIYVSGQRQLSRCFVASCRAASTATKVPFSMASIVDAPNHEGVVSVSSVVKLKSVRFFPAPVAIAPLKSKLHFIKKPTSPKWGAYLQGGVKRISKRDFELIASLSVAQR